MSTTSGNTDLSEAIAQCRIKLKKLIRRWQEGLRETRAALLARASRHRVDTPVVVHAPERIAAAPPTSGGEAEEREVVPSREERSHALATVCERLLQELDREDVKAAEIRFVVHKHEEPSYPRADPESTAGVSDGELVWELRRLIARSGGTIADVARALETRGADLNENARDLLRDELEALDADLETLNAYLSDPVDWDREFGWLLAGEISPCDDFGGDEDEENDDRA
jgi:hypothetical protein